MKTNKRLIQAESLEDIINYKVYRIGRLLRYKFKHDMKVAGLEMTQEQYFILFQLWGKDGQYQTELSDDLLGDKPNITRILDGMEKKGFVERRSDPRDRRKFRVFVAAQGQKVHELYKALVFDSRAKDYQGLNDGDLEEFKRILNTIEKNIVTQLS